MKIPNQRTFSIESPDHTTTKEDEIALVDKLFEIFNGTESYLDSFFSADLCVWLKQQIDKDFSTDLFQDYVDQAKVKIQDQTLYTEQLQQIRKDNANLLVDYQSLQNQLDAARADSLRLATSDNQKRLEIDRLNNELKIQEACYEILKASSLQEIHDLEETVVHLKAQLWDTLTVQAGG